MLVNCLPAWINCNVDCEKHRSTLKKLCRARRHTDSVGQLRVLYLYVTRACNLRCKHCWVSGGEIAAGELSIGEVHAVLSDAAQLGARRVKITGGEPFVRRDLMKILEYAAGLGFEQEIETNATLITPEVARELVQFRNVRLIVSLDGASAPSHEFIRKERGSYESTTRGLGVLRNLNARVNLTTLVHKKNLSELREIIEIGLAKGVENHRFILTLQWLGRGRTCEDVELSWSEISRCVQEIYAIRRELGSTTGVGTSHSTLPPALQPVDEVEFTDCGWGRTLCGVLSTGDVSICGAAYETLSLVAGNIRQQPLSSIWEKSHFFSLLRSIKYTDLEGICGNCIVAPMCRGMCRVNAFAVYGKLTAPYPFCQLAYNKNCFPTYALVDKDRDCNFENLKRPRSRASGRKP